MNIALFASLLLHADRADVYNDEDFGLQLMTNEVKMRENCETADVIICKRAREQEIK